MLQINILGGGVCNICTRRARFSALLRHTPTPPEASWTTTWMNSKKAFFTLGGWRAVYRFRAKLAAARTNGEG